MTRLLERDCARTLAYSMIVCLLVMLVAASAAAQRPSQPPPQRTQTARRPETIEIRGQVPTPQVVTVRPREMAPYSRRVLVPAFFDHNFWPSILPPLQIVSPGRSPSDSSTRSTADSAAAAKPSPPRSPSGTPPALLRR